MTRGLTTAGLGLPDHDKALVQHDAYVGALKQCGLSVFVLDPDEAHPDSVFVEDVALLTPDVAIITNPGAASRKGEVPEMESVIRHFYPVVERIRPPGTLDAGDIMMAGSHFYIALSARTNAQGAAQMISILDHYGMSGSTVPFREMLHLKTGLSYLENNNLLVAGEFQGREEFNAFNAIQVPDGEAYAANSVWINGSVLVPAGYPHTRDRIAGLGYHVLEVDVSEFRKLDGGLSCLSLRF
jgi:dimethylargininase